MSAHPRPRPGRLQTADLPLGTSIDGRYVLKGVLGRGGMGVVYDALHERLDRMIALKVLGPAWAKDEVATARFQREARTAAKLGRPHVPFVYDVGRLPSGRPYIAMERLHGRSLEELSAATGPLPPSRVAELLESAAKALDALHAQDMVHRDVKPANLFHARGEDGSDTVKLLDFGLVSTALFGGGTRLTRQGQVYGTPHYMAPEMSGGLLPDRRADIYSLAVVAYQLLCGCVPFDSPNPLRIFTLKLQRDPPTMLERSGARFDDALENALARGLAREPAARPASAAELAEEVRRAAGGEPVSAARGAPPICAPTVLCRPIRRV